MQRGDANASALVEHAWTAGDRIDWDSARILSISSGYYSRLALEAIHIRRQRKALNPLEVQVIWTYHIIHYSAVWTRRKRKNNRPDVNTFCRADVNTSLCCDFCAPPLPFCFFDHFVIYFSDFSCCLSVCLYIHV